MPTGKLAHSKLLHRTLYTTAAAKQILAVDRDSRRMTWYAKREIRAMAKIVAASGDHFRRGIRVALHFAGSSSRGNGSRAQCRLDRVCWIDLCIRRVVRARFARFHSK